MNLYNLREDYPIWTKRKIAQCISCGDLLGLTFDSILDRVASCGECGNRNRDPIPWTELFLNMRAEEILKEWD